MSAGRWACVAAGAALDVRDAVSYGRAAGDASVYGVRALAYAGGQMARAGRADRRHAHAETIIGASFYHTVGDRERALDQMATDFASLQNDIMMQAGWRADPYRAASGPLWDWWQSVGVPTMNEWQTFHANQTGSWVTRWATNWETFEQWQDRLKRLRDLARSHGLTLASPEPVELPKTITQRAEEGIGGGLTSLWGILKMVLYAAIGITGFLALYAVFRDVRGHGRSLTA